MLSSMNIDGVDKSLLTRHSAMTQDKYDITLLLVEKKGGFMKLVPDWVKVEEASWFEQVKPIIMQPPQQTIKDYIKRKEFFKVPTFIYSYILSEKLFKNRYIFYKNVFKTVPDHDEDYDIAISYQGPTDIIDYYIANKVNAKQKVSWVHFDVSKHMINEKLYERLYRKFDKLFVVSKEAREKLVQKIPSVEEKATVLLNIISGSLISDMSKKDIDFDENYKGLRLITIGRLSKEKGQDLAIEVLAKLRKDGYEVRWYCIGEGKQRIEYEQLIGDYGLENEFILMGSKSNPYPFILKSDIYVQTSRHEGYCLTLAEAKSLNKPIVTTDFTGAREQIVNGYNGLIVDLSVEDLYEKIKLLIEEKVVREDLSSNLSKLNIDTTEEITKLLKYIG